MFARARPVPVPAVVFAQLGRSQLQDRFHAAFQPEFLAAFDTIDLFDRRLDRRATDG